MTESIPPLFALVVNWNRPDDTLACLESIEAQLGVQLQIIVVDNGSTDDSVVRIGAAFPHVEILALENNLYFGGGANVGLKRALERGAEFILFINNDAVLSPDAVKTMLAHRSEEVGLLAPMIYYFDHRDVIWSMGGKQRPWLLEIRQDHQKERDPGGWPAYIDQDFVTSCCVLFPRATLERVGFYDTDSFVHYYEDSDLSFRIRAANLYIRVVPGAKVWHKVAMSSGGTDAPQERYWMARSSVAFFRKHARGLQWAAILLWRFGSALRTTARLFGAQKYASIRAYWLGLRDGLSGAATQDWDR